jgi:hypothetical protein
MTHQEQIDNARAFESWWVENSGRTPKGPVEVLHVKLWARKAWLESANQNISAIDKTMKPIPHAKSPEAEPTWSLVNVIEKNYGLDFEAWWQTQAKIDFVLRVADFKYLLRMVAHAAWLQGQIRGRAAVVWHDTERLTWLSNHPLNATVLGVAGEDQAKAYAIVTPLPLRDAIDAAMEAEKKALADQQRQMKQDEETGEL